MLGWLRRLAKWLDRRATDKIAATLARFDEDERARAGQVLERERD